MEHQRVEVEDFASGLPAVAWETVTSREGSDGQITYQLVWLPSSRVEDAELLALTREKWSDQ